MPNSRYPLERDRRVRRFMSELKNGVKSINLTYEHYFCTPRSVKLFAVDTTAF